jgi:hypothetical protein
LISRAWLLSAKHNFLSWSSMHRFPKEKSYTFFFSECVSIIWLNSVTSNFQETK